MTTFYDRIGEGEPVVEAVRAASLRRLQDLREAGRPDHPREWAGFVAVGDWH